MYKEILKQITGSNTAQLLTLIPSYPDSSIVCYMISSYSTRVIVQYRYKIWSQSALDLPQLLLVVVVSFFDHDDDSIRGTLSRRSYIPVNSRRPSSSYCLLYVDSPESPDNSRTMMMVYTNWTCRFGFVDERSGNVVIVTTTVTMHHCRSCSEDDTQMCARSIDSIDK